MDGGHKADSPRSILVLMHYCTIELLAFWICASLNLLGQSDEEVIQVKKLVNNIRDAKLV